MNRRRCIVMRDRMTLMIHSNTPSTIVMRTLIENNDGSRTRLNTGVAAQSGRPTTRTVVSVVSRSGRRLHARPERNSSLAAISATYISIWDTSHERPTRVETYFTVTVSSRSISALPMTRVVLIVPFVTSTRERRRLGFPIARPCAMRTVRSPSPFGSNTS